MRKKRRARGERSAGCLQDTLEPSLVANRLFPTAVCPAISQPISP